MPRSGLTAGRVERYAKPERHFADQVPAVSRPHVIMAIGFFQFFAAFGGSSLSTLSLHPSGFSGKRSENKTPRGGGPSPRPARTWKQAVLRRLSNTESSSYVPSLGYRKTIGSCVHCLSLPRSAVGTHYRQDKPSTQAREAALDQYGFVL